MVSSPQLNLRNSLIKYPGNLAGFSLQNPEHLRFTFRPVPLALELLVSSEALNPCFNCATLVNGPRAGTADKTPGGNHGVA